ALGQMDFETAAKLSGARFVVLKKGLARLERALAQFMLDVHTSAPHSYTEVSPPILVRDGTMFGTAQLPKFKEDQFIVSAPLPDNQKANIESLITEKRLAEKPIGQDWTENRVARAVEIGMSFVENNAHLWLIPTAEVPLTNLVRETIVDEDKLPMRLTACTPC